MSWSIGLFQQYSGNYEPSWIKFKYGAWYLDPKTWQKRDTDQPLMDPKALKDQEMSEAKKKSKELVSEARLRVPTSSGNHGKPGKSLKKFHAWKNHGI